MSLRPDETIRKALLSTTSRLIGEYEGDGMLLTHAWPDFHDSSAPARWAEGSVSRSAYILVFKTEPFEKGVGKRLPSYSATGDILASYLCVLFGKRFDHHGIIEESGFFHVPDLSHFGGFCNPSLPCNSHAPRVDYPIALNLSELIRLDPLLHTELQPRFVQTFQGAAKFYMQALENFERDPEIAYLNLITAGEILSNFKSFDKNNLLDQQTKDLLDRVKKELSGGDDVANQIMGKILLVKRRFVQTITNLVDLQFFGRSESKNEWAWLKQDSFEAAIGAAYDLRSRYVHTGVPFGGWISLVTGGNNEVMIGRPVVGDEKLGRILGLAPTFVGLERVIRYCLLRFAEENGAYVNPS